MKTVIVTGGRNYDDYIMLQEVLDFIEPDLIIEGGANGADSLARNYAAVKEIPGFTYSANWNIEGKAAGPNRNARMLADYPEAIVVAFPGGKGTANCVKQAVERNMIVLQVHK